MEKCINNLVFQNTSGANAACIALNIKLPLAYRYFLPMDNFKKKKFIQWKVLLERQEMQNSPLRRLPAVYFRYTYRQIIRAFLANIFLA